jgi:hypothetical protein
MAELTSEWAPLSPETGREPGVTPGAFTEFRPKIEFAVRERVPFGSWDAARESAGLPEVDVVTVKLSVSATVDDELEHLPMIDVMRSQVAARDFEASAGLVVTIPGLVEKVTGALDDSAMKRHNRLTGCFGWVLQVILTLMGQNTLFQAMRNVSWAEATIAVSQTISGGTELPRAPVDVEHPDTDLTQAAERMVLQLFGGPLLVDPNPESLTSALALAQEAMRRRADLILAPHGHLAAIAPVPQALVPVVGYGRKQYPRRAPIGARLNVGTLLVVRGCRYG